MNWIKIGDMPQSGNIVRAVSEKITSEGAKKSRKVEVGDIILSNSMSFGKPYIMGISGYIHDGWFVIREYEKNLYKDYLCQLLSSDYVQKQYRRMAAGGVVLNISSDLVNSVVVPVPVLDEQKKIADFLSVVDERIEKQRQLVEVLKRYKRGVINGTFDNKIQGKNWKTHKLSEILTERCTYCEKDGTYEHVTLSREGIFPKTERYDRDYLVSSDDKRYKITKCGDICYNPANMKFGVICLNTYGDAIFSPIYVTLEITSNIDKNMLAYCITRPNFINRSLKYQQGTVYERMAVSPEDLLSMTIDLPDEKSQKEISQLFVLIDESIKREIDKLTTLQRLKSGLLQQMFI